MKAKVIVTLKEGVLDPQGATIKRALAKMGHSDVRAVRQGKFFEIEFDESSPEADVLSRTREISEKVLSNPIIESFEVEDIR